MVHCARAEAEGRGGLAMRAERRFGFAGAPMESATGYSEISDAEDLFEPTAETLWVWLHENYAGRALMPRRHRHNAAEVNYVVRGSVTYLKGGQLCRVPTARLTLFWGSIPHQVVALGKGTRFYALHIPLALFLATGLPEAFVERILRGDSAVEPDATRGETDLRLISDWHAALTQRDDRYRQVVLLELRARLLRLAFALAEDSAWKSEALRHPVGEDLDRVEQMAGFVARNYTGPITVLDVAREVGLHPKYATQLFHRRCGVSLKQYITLNRVCHAQMLLVTTDIGTLEIAMHSGFGSASRFYAAFSAACGESPLKYRQSMRLR